MDPSAGTSQLLLFTAPSTSSPRTPRRRRRRPGAGGRPRMIERLEGLAATAEREARDCRRAGDMVGARAARERAIGARRAAQILRAGPDGVATVLNGSHPEAA